MTATLLSAAVTCVASLFLGQAALRLAGAREWSWLAPPVGISIGMLVAAPAIYLPGRSATSAALLVVLAIAAIVWCGREPAHRPPLSGLLAALPVAVLTLVPFLAAGRAGILGTTFDNDMAVHLWWAEAFVSQAAADAAPLPPDYPLGPHAMVGATAKGLGIGVEGAFAGWTMALPVINAWTALALVRRAAWFRQAVVATVVGMPFLIAAYYGQGSFKEVLQAGLVLATVLALAGYGPGLERGRWVPLALLVAGMVSVYSVTGLPWPLVLLGLWLAVKVVLRLRSGGLAGLRAAIAAQLPAVGIGCAVLAVALLPQATRLLHYASERRGTGIPKESLGNLFGSISGWEAFGVWTNADYRLPAPPFVTGGIWTALLVGLALGGAFWALRRGRWMLPLAAAAAMLIWALSAQSQSPYVAAKALAIASPLVLAVVVLPLGEDERRRGRSLAALFGRSPGQLYSWGLAALLGLVLLARVGLSDAEALRISPIGPLGHARELRELAAPLEGERTLFLGNDDYVRWELAGIPVLTPVLGTEAEAVRPAKRWGFGQALDFDSVSAALLNLNEWVITTRDAAGSAPPPQLKRVATSPHYELWRRAGTVAPRRTLAEGEAAGAVLDCSAVAGRAIVRGGGVAAIRPEPVILPGVLVDPGETASTALPLPRGSWELAAPYISPDGLRVSAPGLSTTMPPNLDNLGPRWRIGKLDVRGDEPTTMTFEAAAEPLLAPPRAAANLVAIVATPVARERVVPVRQACGKYVDWYRPAGDRSG
jgi:hypothetical protein